MGNRWKVTVLNIAKNGNTVTISEYDTSSVLVSGKLKLQANDTSVLNFSIAVDAPTVIMPNKSLARVEFGQGNSWDLKFFGTISKKTRDYPNGLESFEAVGVLGSYKYIPNYTGYANDATLGSILETERKRFMGEYASPGGKYTPSAWELLYDGQALIPQRFGYLNPGVYTNLNLKMSCNLDRIQKNAKNAYEFIKAITKDGAYVNNTQYKNGTWVENGAEASFVPLLVGINNTQQAKYDENLISFSLNWNTYPTRVEMVNKDKKEVVTGGSYPNPFNSARINVKDKSDGSTYTSEELQTLANAELTKDYMVADATCFDRHVVDDSVDWFDMSKYVRMVFKIGNLTTSNTMQISEITYDLCNSANDRVMLGLAQTTLTDSLNAETDSVQSSGGTMTGSLSFVENGQTATVDANELEIRGRIFGTCNLIDMASLEQGAINTSNGTESASTIWLRSGYASVNGSATYTISYTPSNLQVYVIEYNASKGYVTSPSYAVGTWTTNASTKYVRLLIRFPNNPTIVPSDVSTLQLEKGSSASSYVPYAMDNVELTERVTYKKIYFTPTNCNSEPSYDGCYYFKENGIVHVHIGASTPSSMGSVINIGTLPSGYRPKGVVRASGESGNISNVQGYAYFRVMNDGTIDAQIQYTFFGVDFCFLAEN